MHCKDNYFSKIEVSDLDVELEKGTLDDDYVLELERWLPYVMEKSRPELIFFQAGVDIHKDDRLGKLNISSDGLKIRNRLVVRAALENNAKLVVSLLST
jgi:acetoin utilization deacetylase AcuC-like enzyme